MFPQLSTGASWGDRGFCLLPAPARLHSALRLHLGAFRWFCPPRAVSPLWGFCLSRQLNLSDRFVTRVFPLGGFHFRGLVALSIISHTLDIGAKVFPSFDHLSPLSGSLLVDPPPSFVSCCLCMVSGFMVGSSYPFSPLMVVLGDPLLPPLGACRKRTLPVWASLLQFLMAAHADGWESLPLLPLVGRLGVSPSPSAGCTWGAYAACMGLLLLSPAGCSW